LVADIDVVVAGGEMNTGSGVSKIGRRLKTRSRALNHGFLELLPCQNIFNPIHRD